MIKDFDAWNELKKRVDQRSADHDLYFHEREVWWCSLGLNIGVESDGKNEDFKRPVLILKKFNADMLWAAPLTSVRHEDRFHRQVMLCGSGSWVSLTQIRTISTKRLLRKIGRISHADFSAVLSDVFSFIKAKPRR